MAPPLLLARNRFGIFPLSQKPKTTNGLFFKDKATNGGFFEQEDRKKVQIGGRGNSVRSMGKPPQKGGESHRKGSKKNAQGGRDKKFAFSAG